VFDIIFVFFVFKVFFSLGGESLQMGNLCPDVLPFGRSEDGVLKDFLEDRDFFLDG
jgi:hypothetical protein